MHSSPEYYARAVAYSQGAYAIYFATTAYTLLVLWLFIRGRVAPRLRDWAERNLRRPWQQFLLYAPTLLLVFALFLLPADVWSQWHERKYGQSVESWPSWFGRWTIAEITAVITGTLIIALLYFALRRSRRRWWLWLWMTAVPLILLVVYIQPVVLDPLFNTYEPLDRPSGVGGFHRKTRGPRRTRPPEATHLSVESQ